MDRLHFRLHLSLSARPAGNEKPPSGFCVGWRVACTSGLPADPRHADDGLLGQPVQPEHPRRLGQPDTGAITYGFAARAQHVDRIGEILRDRDVQYFFTRSRTTTDTSTTRPTRPSARCTGSSGCWRTPTPKLFGWEIDILHNWSGRVRFLNATTHQPDISVYALIQAQAKRVMGWHIKDGFRNTAQTGTGTGGPPESGGSPYFQTFLRTPTFTDAVISGEGDLSAGPVAGHPNADPDEPGFKVPLREREGSEPAQLHHRERQRPGGSADPGRSLRHAKAPAPRRCCRGA